MQCAKSELCIFDRPSQQVVIERGSFEEIYPTNAFTGNGDIEFNINGSQYEYLDLRDTLLSLKVHVTADGKENLKADSDVIPSNYLFHSLFSDVIVGLNSTKVEGGNNNYGKKSLIETILNFNNDSKKTILKPVGYYKNEEEAKKMIALSESFTLCSTLQLDIFEQPQYLIPGINVHVRCIRAPAKLTLKSKNSKPSIDILEAKLFVRRVKVDQSVTLGHQIGLSKQNAIYPIKSKEVVSFTMSTGSSSFYKEQLFGDRRLPNFILVTFQSADSYLGTFSTSSSEFEHFNLTSLTLSKNTDYREKYTQDFQSNNYTTSYVQSLIRNLGYLDKNMNCGITLEEFKTKYPFFTFVLAPDFDLNQSQLPQQGNLKLDIKFATPLVESAYVIIYGVFENEIQVTSNHTILL